MKLFILTTILVLVACSEQTTQDLRLKGKKATPAHADRNAADGLSASDALGKVIEKLMSAKSIELGPKKELSLTGGDNVDAMIAEATTKLEGAKVALDGTEPKITQNKAAVDNLIDSITKDIASPVEGEIAQERPQIEGKITSADESLATAKEAEEGADHAHGSLPATDTSKIASYDHADQSFKKLTTQEILASQTHLNAARSTFASLDRELSHSQGEVSELELKLTQIENLNARLLKSLSSAESDQSQIEALWSKFNESISTNETQVLAPMQASNEAFGKAISNLHLSTKEFEEVTTRFSSLVTGLRSGPMGAILSEYNRLSGAIEIIDSLLKTETSARITAGLTELKVILEDVVYNLNIIHEQLDTYLNEQNTLLTKITERLSTHEIYLANQKGLLKDHSNTLAHLVQIVADQKEVSATQAGQIEDLRARITQQADGLQGQRELLTRQKDMLAAHKSTLSNIQHIYNYLDQFVKSYEPMLTLRKKAYLAHGFSLDDIYLPRMTNIDGWRNYPQFNILDNGMVVDGNWVWKSGPYPELVAEPLYGIHTAKSIVYNGHLYLLMNHELWRTDLDLGNPVFISETPDRGNPVMELAADGIVIKYDMMSGNFRGTNISGMKIYDDTYGLLDCFDHLYFKSDGTPEGSRTNTMGSRDSCPFRSYEGYNLAENAPLRECSYGTNYTCWIDWSPFEIYRWPVLSDKGRYLINYPRGEWFIKDQATGAIVAKHSQHDRNLITIRDSKAYIFDDNIHADEPKSLSIKDLSTGNESKVTLGAKECFVNSTHFYGGFSYISYRRVNSRESNKWIYFVCQEGENTLVHAYSLTRQRLYSASITVKSDQSYSHRWSTRVIEGRSGNFLLVLRDSLRESSNILRGSFDGANLKLTRLNEVAEASGGRVIPSGADFSAGLYRVKRTRHGSYDPIAAPIILEQNTDGFISRGSVWRKANGDSYLLGFQQSRGRDILVRIDSSQGSYEAWGDNYLFSQNSGIVGHQRGLLVATDGMGSFFNEIDSYYYPFVAKSRDRGNSGSRFDRDIILTFPKQLCKLGACMLLDPDPDPNAPQFRDFTYGPLSPVHQVTINGKGLSANVGRGRDFELYYGGSLLADLAPGDTKSYPLSFFKYKGKVLFTAYSADKGRELYITDLTQAGTKLVKDINPGPSSSTPQSMYFAGGYVYFSAFTAAQGYELWRTDGTTAGTNLIRDILPGKASSLANIITHYGADKLLLTAQRADVPEGSYLRGVTLEPIDTKISQPAEVISGYGFKAGVAESLNWAKLDEKWLKAADNKWYFILPNGYAYLWDGERSPSVDPYYFRFAVHPSVYGDLGQIRAN